MSFGMWTRVDPRNRVSVGDPDPRRIGQFWGVSRPTVKYREYMA